MGTPPHPWHFTDRFPLVQTLQTTSQTTMKLAAVFLVAVFLGVSSAMSISDAQLQQMVRALEKKAEQGGDKPDPAKAEEPTLEEKIDKLLGMVTFMAAEPFLMKAEAMVHGFEEVCPVVMYYAEKHGESEEEKKPEGGKVEEKKLEELRRALVRLTRGEKGAGEGKPEKSKPEKEAEEEEALILGRIDWKLVYHICSSIQEEESGEKSMEKP